MTKKPIKTFKVPFERISVGYFEVEAVDEKEALEKAQAFNGTRRIEKVDTKFTKSKIEEIDS